MAWDEFISDGSFKTELDGQILTDIEGPKCGRRVDYDSTVVLTSYPPQYSYWCKCGWHGTSYIRRLVQPMGNC